MEYNFKNAGTGDNPLNLITLEDTSLFDYKGNQSTVYNRLKEQGINTVGDVFTKVTPNMFDSIGEYAFGNKSYDYGNRFVKEEIWGIITLIRYMYADEVSCWFKQLLESNVDMVLPKPLSHHYVSYGFPGDVFKAIDSDIPQESIARIDFLYKVLKSCGFDKTAVKSLIDIAYERGITNTSLGEFLCSLDVETLEAKFERMQRKYGPFIVILDTIKRFYKIHCKNEKSSYNK